MPDGAQVTIRRITIVPSKDKIPVKDFRDFYRFADGDGDGKLSKDELKTYRQITALAMLGSLGDPKKEKALEDKIGRFHDPYNVVVSFSDKLDPKKTGFVPLDAIEELAKKYQKPEELSVAELGQEHIYDYETGELTDTIDVPPPKEAAPQAESN